MLDVHTLNRKIHGLKDFLLHIFTITVGLLIALMLEGMVEARHHRHQVHEADAAMHTEIESNAHDVAIIQQQIKSATAQLDSNLATLDALRKQPEQQNISLDFQIALRGFDDTAWRTTQTAGTFGYMPYEDASEFSGIYNLQHEVYEVEQQAVNDIMSAASLVITSPEVKNLSPGRIDTIVDRIGMAKMRLIFLGGLVSGLDASYKRYQTRHP